MLSADTFFVGTLKGIGKVYLHAVVDTYGSYAFGFLHVSKQPEAAVAVLHNEVLPFYRQLEVPVKAVLTDNGREFCGSDNHPYELYLELSGIEHRRTKIRSPKTNGFVERFNGNGVRRVSFGSSYVRRFTNVLRRCKRTSTPGFATTIPNARIWGIATRVAGLSKRSICSLAKKVKMTLHVLTSASAKNR